MINLPRTLACKAKILEGVLAMHYEVRLNAADEEPVAFETDLFLMGTKQKATFRYGSKFVMIASRKKAIDEFLNQRGRKAPSTNRAIVKAEIASTKYAEAGEVVREEPLPPTPPASSIRLPTQTGRRGFIRLGAEV